jgi:hypothetical protein
MTDAAGVPVALEVAPRPTLTGRVNDTPDFWAGGRIRNNETVTFCTAGWPVIAGGVEYMLTAGHCGRPGGPFSNGDGSRFFGYGAYENVDHDVMLIQTDVGGRMWDGGVGSGEFTKTIVGSDDAFPNEWVCTSGSFTGAQCWYQITNEFQYQTCLDDVYGNFECYSDLVLARWDGAGPATRSGDSGGPVFIPVGADQQLVVAKGTITGTHSVGAQDYLMFQDFITAQRDFGINVVTG